MRAGRRLALLALLVTGCAAIRIEGQSLRPVDPANIEPIAFLIFQADTPAGYSQVLQRTLESEMQQRGIAARFTIVPGPERRTPGLVAEALADVPGFITIAPSNGTPNLIGVTDPVFYDLRAHRILQHPGPAEPGSGPNGTTPINDGMGRSEVIWRGRAHARGGFSEANLAQVASQIVARLIADHVLRGAP